MSTKRSRQFFYVLRRTLTIGGTAGYILSQTGFLTNTVTGASVSVIVYILAGWAGVTLIKDYNKRATAKDNPDISQLARATAMNGMIPWILILIIAGALKLSIANIFQHLVILSSFQIGGKIFEGYEIKYDTMLKRGIKSKKDIEIEQKKNEVNSV